MNTLLKRLRLPNRWPNGIMLMRIGVNGVESVNLNKLNFISICIN